MKTSDLKELCEGLDNLRDAIEGEALDLKCDRAAGLREQHDPARDAAIEIYLKKAASHAYLALAELDAAYILTK